MTELMGMSSNYKFRGTEDVLMREVNKMTVQLDINAVDGANMLDLVASFAEASVAEFTGELFFLSIYDMRSGRQGVRKE